MCIDLARGLAWVIVVVIIVIAIVIVKVIVIVIVIVTALLRIIVIVPEEEVAENLDSGWRSSWSTWGTHILPHPYWLSIAPIGVNLSHLERHHL